MTDFASLLADPALTAVLAALPNARLVGGCVRDTLAGRPVSDVDLATPEPPEQAQTALEAAGLRVIQTGLAHGTVTAISLGRAFEVTTLRRDQDTDGRHARVTWTDDFNQDAARRDFTINAMSLDQAGLLHDPFGGATDLHAGRVRFVGDAARRVAEDYLRILRFFRFHARYGIGAPDQAAAQAVAGGVPGLKILSPERVWSELKLILGVPEPLPAVTLMRELGVLQSVLPEAVNMDRLARLVHAGAPPGPMLRLAALLDGDAAALADRLRLSTRERDLLTGMRSGPAPQPQDDDAELRRKLASEPREHLEARIWLAGDGEAWSALRTRLAAQETPVFPLGGRDALALGGTPGPAIGYALQDVHTWWLASGCTPTAEECRQQLRQAVLIHDADGPG